MTIKGAPSSLTHPKGSHLRRRGVKGPNGWKSGQSRLFLKATFRSFFSLFILTHSLFAIRLTTGLFSLLLHLGCCCCGHPTESSTSALHTYEAGCLARSLTASIGIAIPVFNKRGPVALPEKAHWRRPLGFYSKITSVLPRQLPIGSIYPERTYTDQPHNTVPGIVGYRPASEPNSLLDQP